MLFSDLKRNETFIVSRHKEPRLLVKRSDNSARGFYWIEPRGEYSEKNLYTENPIPMKPNTRVKKVEVFHYWGHFNEGAGTRDL